MLMSPAQIQSAVGACQIEPWVDAARKQVGYEIPALRCSCVGIGKLIADPFDMNLCSKHAK
jgi:hypothetical protein